MKKFSVLLMILAIVCALFADKIDMAVKGNKKVKKVIVVFSAVSYTHLQQKRGRADGGQGCNRQVEGIRRRSAPSVPGYFLRET